VFITLSYKGLDPMMPDERDAAPPVAAGKSMGHYTRLFETALGILVLIIPSVLLLAVLSRSYCPSSTARRRRSCSSRRRFRRQWSNRQSFRTRLSRACQRAARALRRKILAPERLVSLIKEIDPYPADAG